MGVTCRHVRAGVEAEVDAFGPEQWEEVARLGSAGRSGHEAATEWVHRLRPSLNLGAWTEQEDARLVQLQAQHGMHSVSVFACNILSHFFFSKGLVSPHPGCAEWDSCWSKWMALHGSTFARQLLVCMLHCKYLKALAG